MTTQNYPQETAVRNEPIPEDAPQMPDKAYQINIEQLDHGYIVRVGCKSFAIETKEKLIIRLAAYLSDVPGVTKDFFDKKFEI